MNENLPLTLEEARKSDRCRICHQAIKATMQPAGWKDRFDELLYPVHVVLNAGQEFAHKSCLPTDPPKPTSEQKPKNSSLDYWTHTYSDGKEKLGHTSDCHFWGARICDCGLLTHLRAAHSEDKYTLYPKYREEMSQHDQRIYAVNPLAESMIFRFEQLLRQQAVHYQERPCDGCDQIIMDCVVNNTPHDTSRDTLYPWPEDKPMFIADLFNSNIDPDDPTRVKTYCRDCR
jgi:hypothetical protein